MRKNMFMIIFSALSLTNAEVMTVQNGLNGYEGCVDTYLTEGGNPDDGNHGPEELLRLRGGM